ncbi:MAG: ABC transporter ATP-binding protein, partial [Candidatus Omnitrophica bacterium]|nr:ABC transporter ATP-binding protein [Candidatus Omnitrophota bacterium]
MSVNPIVCATDLTKRFNGKTAVDHIDFEICEGEIAGLLGPNGAGKTTTIRMLLNIADPDEGRLELFGRNYTRARQAILSKLNTCSATMSLPGKLTVWQNLRVYSDFYEVPQAGARIDFLMDRCQLRDMRNTKAFNLSTGQQMRLALAKAFLNKPRLLL